ncbi:MAG: hypothetical protein AABY22_08785 [Nanoarchaeota archaeon]
MWKYSGQIRQWIKETCGDCGAGHLSESIRFIWNAKFKARAGDSKPQKNLIRLGIAAWKGMNDEQRMNLVKHECLPCFSKLITDSGTMTIKEIVEKKYNGKVLSFDIENNLPVFSQISNWKKTRNTSHKKWVKLKSSRTGPNKQLICTEDHRCAFVEDILKPIIVKYSQAKHLKGKYIVRRSFQRKTNSENPIFNQEQLSIIFGGLLGDFSISADGYLAANHGPKQKEYAIFKSLILNGNIKSSYSGFRDEMSNTQIYVGINEQTKLIRKKIYTPKKEAKSLIPYINKVSLAFWFMDDGCCNFKAAQYRNLSKLNGISLHTEGFDLENVALLSKMLTEKFNIQNKIRNRYTKGGKKYFIFLNKINSEILLSKISKFIPECMEYKIPLEYRGGIKYSFNNKRVNISLKKITEIKYLPCYESALYDITVENTHNFFADNSLVHNCCHIVGYQRYGATEPHGREWQTLMIRAGCNPERLVDVDLSKLSSYVKAGCPSCQKEFYISKTKASRIKWHGKKFLCQNCNVAVELK